MMKRAQSWGEAFEELYGEGGSADGEGERRILDLGGESRTYICKLWDGVYLWGNDVHSRHIDYYEHGLNRWNCAVLNLCHTGRCEVKMRDDAYVYMTPGLLNLNNREPENGYSYPAGQYEGLELAFDLDILAEHFPAELSSFGLGPDVLRRCLEAGNGSYMASVSDCAMQRSRMLYECLRDGSLLVPGYRFYALSLLYHLKNGEASELRSGRYVTRGQRRIAVEAERILTEDYRKRYTVEELSRRFGVSASALKKYFEAVFGSPVSRYLREKRMKRAEELLGTTDTSVGETAELCGYENQGKFGSAFKAYAGVSPLEYRRLHRAEKCAPDRGEGAGRGEAE